jgi:cytochrome c oxidase subunit 4
VVPLRLLAAVWLGLIVLTAVTVGAARVNLGGAALWVALTIAALKASLVALYFMHLRWDRRMNAVIFVSALLFLMLFVGLALMDTTAYQPELIPGFAPSLGR